MRRAVILFDNDCGFCRWSLSKLLARDRHVGCGLSRSRASRPTTF
jgi:hypothetical protein